jgi:SAM-dependent methyltransferase
MTSIPEPPGLPGSPANANSPDASDAALDAVLAELEGADNYRRWLLELVRPYVRGAVLEVGAGRGTFSEDLRACGNSLTAVEPSARLAEHLRTRVAGLSAVDVVVGVLSDVIRTDFDAAVMLNVLEHIEDDAAALAEVFARLAPGGTFSVWVPAFQALLGDFDRRIGHHRRYTRDGLVAKFRAAGFEIETAHYANLPGFFAWFLVVRVLRARPTTGGLSDVYDRFIVPLTRRVEKRWKPPFGQSVFVVGRRPVR